MPYFRSDDVDISPDRFLEECSNKELKETFQILKDGYGYGLPDEDDEPVRSETQRQFNHNLQSLKNNWLSVCKEDAEIINILGKKYGLV
jgi:hypothetical protein